MIDLNETLKSLAKERPVFHSEADFQHALAWRLQTLHPEAKIRLEYRVEIERNGVSAPAYLDIWVQTAEETIAIELKYATQRFVTIFAEERFSLKEQSAQNLVSYNIVKDILRVENALKAGCITRGYICALTNDPYYWRQQQRQAVARMEPFRLHEGRRLQGALNWLLPVGAIPPKGYESALELQGEYTLQWNDYSDFGDYGNPFRYLLVTIE